LQRDVTNPEAKQSETKHKPIAANSNPPQNQDKEETQTQTKFQIKSESFVYDGMLYFVTGANF
jgi:hypothetical protein